MPGRHAPEEERFDIAQKGGDDLLEIPVVGNVLERRIDQHASLTALISDRPLDDLAEERGDRLVRGQSALKPSEALPDGLF